jgi:hypothetical protein
VKGNKVNAMLTSERERLVSTMSHEPASALGIVVKYGGCVALAALLIVAAVRGNEDVAGDARGHAAPSASTAKASTAAAHRKEVFDARRARFAAKASGLDAAGITPITRAEAFAPRTPGSSDLDRSASPTQSPSLVSHP